MCVVVDAGDDRRLGRAVLVAVAAVPVTTADGAEPGTRSSRRGDSAQGRTSRPEAGTDLTRWSGMPLCCRVSISVRCRDLRSGGSGDASEDQKAGNHPRFQELLVVRTYASAFNSGTRGSKIQNTCRRSSRPMQPM